MKRSQQNREISPPSVRRKIDSTTTSKHVSNFFTPLSQKEPAKLVWSIVKGTLVVGRYASPINAARKMPRPVKIAAFDLDDTLIKPKKGENRFVRNTSSHMWWDAAVPSRLKELHNDGYIIVILTNQSTISLKDNAKAVQKDTLSLKNFKDQMTNFLSQLDLPISVYAATGNDQYRKPRIGMWTELRDDYDLDSSDALDVTSSFYIGDAAGREQTDKRRKDHATSDRDLAANIGIPFRTPEEFFLGLETESYSRAFEPKVFLQMAPNILDLASLFVAKGAQELVIFVGSPGAGKSSFFWKELQPLGYERVNQDQLKTRDRCIKAARQLLDAGKSVAVDNTNRDPETRAHWAKIAREYNIPIRCVVFTASARLCEHNDAFRAHNKEGNPENRTLLPPIAFRSYVQSFVQPVLSEGFEEIINIDFMFAGTEYEKEIWSKYWVSKFST